MAHFRELRRKRELSGLTQTAAAARSRIDRATLNMFEHGHVRLSPAAAARLERIVRRALERRARQLSAAVEVSNSPELRDELATATG